MKEQTPTLPIEGFVRWRAIRQVLPMARSTWEDGVKNGRYPPAYPLGPGMTAWLAQDIREVIAQVRRGEVPHWPPSMQA